MNLSNASQATHSSAVRQWLIFPDGRLIAHFRRDQPRTFRIVLEFENGLIAHFVVHRRLSPQVGEFVFLEPTLREIAQKHQTMSYGSMRAMDEFGVEINLLDSPFQHVDDWEVEATLSADSANSSGTHPSDEGGLLKPCIAEETKRLQSAVAAFVGNLDQEVLSRLDDQSRLLPSHYNYFAAGDPILRRNRLQGQKVCGLVFRNFVEHVPSGLTHGYLSRAVDNGTSLVDTLMKHTGASYSVARHMMKCPPEIVAKAWGRDLDRMQRVLDAVKPEFRPKSDSEWIALIGLFKAIKTTFRLSEESFQSAGWLNDAARDRFRLWPNEQERDTSLMMVGDFLETTREVAEELVGRLSDTASPALRYALLSLLFQMRIKAAIGLSRAWHVALQREQECIIGSAADRCEDRWPVPMESFETNTRRLVALTSPEALLQEGRVMRHCVASYAHRCSLGGVQIWSVQDKKGNRCTTLATDFCDEEGRSASVVQHHGVSNSAADPESALSADELLAALTATPDSMKDYHHWRSQQSRRDRHLRKHSVALAISRASVKAAAPEFLSQVCLLLKSYSTHQ